MYVCISHRREKNCVQFTSQQTLVYIIVPKSVLAFYSISSDYRLATLPTNTAFSRRSKPYAHRISAMPNNARVLSRYPPSGAVWVCCPSFFNTRA